MKVFFTVSKVCLIICICVMTFILNINYSLAMIPQFAKVTEVIYRGGQPESIKDYHQLLNIGIRTIINLRAEVDGIGESKISEELGLLYHHIGIGGSDYIKMPSRNKIEKISAILIHPKSQPVFIHCQHGRDRTGLLIGLYRVHQEGWSPKKAYEEMEAFGFRAVLVGLTAYFWKDTSSGDRGELYEGLLPFQTAE